MSRYRDDLAYIARIVAVCAAPILAVGFIRCVFTEGWVVAVVTVVVFSAVTAVLVAYGVCVARWCERRDW